MMLKYASQVPASSALSSASYIVAAMFENEKWGTKKDADE